MGRAGRRDLPLRPTRTRGACSSVGIRLMAMSNAYRLRVANRAIGSGSSLEQIADAHAQPLVPAAGQKGAPVIDQCRQLRVAGYAPDTSAGRRQVAGGTPRASKGASCRAGCGCPARQETSWRPRSPWATSQSASSLRPSSSAISSACWVPSSASIAHGSPTAILKQQNGLGT